MFHKRTGRIEFSDALVLYPGMRLNQVNALIQIPGPEQWPGMPPLIGLGQHEAQGIPWEVCAVFDGNGLKQVWLESLTYPQSTQAAWTFHTEAARQAFHDGVLILQAAAGARMLKKQPGVVLKYEWGRAGSMIDFIQAVLVVDYAS